MSCPKHGKFAKILISTGVGDCETPVTPTVEFGASEYNLSQSTDLQDRTTFKNAKEGSPSGRAFRRRMSGLSDFSLSVNLPLDTDESVELVAGMYTGSKHRIHAFIDDTRYYAFTALCESIGTPVKVGEIIVQEVQMQGDGEWEPHLDAA